MILSEQHLELLVSIATELCQHEAFPEHLCISISALALGGWPACGTANSCVYQHSFTAQEMTQRTLRSEHNQFS